ncbi:MAG: M23 family metallopeptidase [Treponema sp.]|jgi:murein DD-endopeptidase MepM/ murein hydrolase activator NlpD|nr:M23 family metallopeptidase [Treponema sp.]
MTVRIRFLVLILALVTAGGFAQETVHIIQKGETIYSIARNYGADIQGILSLNGIQDPRKIQAGQRIRIPGGSKEAGQGAASSGAAYIEYRAVRGDSLFGIARKHDVTLQELRAANGLREDYVLKAGDRLKIPRRGETPPALAADVPSKAGAAPDGGGIESGVSVLNSGAAGGTGIQPAARQTAPAVSGGQTVWPVRVKELAYMTGKLYGVAILGERSESVKSLSQGTVISAGPYRGFGKVAIVQMTGGYLYVYGGCESLSVKEGDRVAPGTELGRLGLDGVTSKPQLFLMVYKNNAPIDPAKAPRL